MNPSQWILFIFTWQLDGYETTGRVSRSVCGRVLYIRFSEGEDGSEIVWLSHCERLLGIIMKQRLVPLQAQLVRVGDELRGGLAVVNHGRLSVYKQILSNSS